MIRNTSKISSFSSLFQKVYPFFPAAASATTAIASAYNVLGLHGTAAQWCTNSGSRAKSGKRKTGRPKTTWLGNIIQWTDVDLERVLQATDIRSKWRRTIYGAVKPRIEDDCSQVKSSHRGTSRLRWPSDYLKQQ